MRVAPASEPNPVLLVTCPDRPGLIHAITGVLVRHGVNVVSNDEFVDRDRQQFVMRSEFVGGHAIDSIRADVQAALPEATVKVRGLHRPRIVVLATREAHEAALLDVIAPLEPDYLVLAKYMRILSPAFVDRLAGRMVNIHHSFLPAFAGANPYRRAFERGVKIIGAPAHFVTAELDEGPIIAQDVLPVDHSYRPEQMAQAGRDVEKIVLARALKLLFENRVFVMGNRTIVFA